MLQDDELELDVVVRVDLQFLRRHHQHTDVKAAALTSSSWTHPVLCSLTNERALIPTSTRVASHRRASRPHEVVEPRQLQDDLVVRLLVERPLLEKVAHEDTFEGEAGPFLCASASWISRDRLKTSTGHSRRAS